MRTTRFARVLGVAAVSLSAGGLFVALPHVHAAHQPRPPHHIAQCVCRTPTPAPSLATRPLELVLGDSLSVGLFTTTQARSYPYVVEADRGYTQTPSEITHGYWTTADVLNALPSALPTLDPSYQDEIIELGTNDWSKTASLATFESNYQRILNETAPYRLHLICLSTWRDPAQTNTAGESAGQYDAAIEQMCVAAGGVYVNLQSIYQQADSHCPVGVTSWAGTCDGWHPGDVGASRIASAIVAVMMG